MAINDKKHRELMSRYITHIDSIASEAKMLSKTSSVSPEVRRMLHEPVTYEVEKHYNFYGTRGFIDILFNQSQVTSICEVKPVLTNLGEAIRQLNRAQDAIKKNAITDFTIHNIVQLRLITTLSEVNIDILTKSYPIIKKTKIEIELYCETNDEFYTISAFSISDEQIRKYGDPLVQLWEICKNGIAMNYMDYLGQRFNFPKSTLL